MKKAFELFAKSRVYVYKLYQFVAKMNVKDRVIFGDDIRKTGTKLIAEVTLAKYVTIEDEYPKAAQIEILVERIQHLKKAISYMDILSFLTSASVDMHCIPASKKGMLIEDLVIVKRLAVDVLKKNKELLATLTAN